MSFCDIQKDEEMNSSYCYQQFNRLDNIVELTEENEYKQFIYMP